MLNQFFQIFAIKYNILWQCDIWNMRPPPPPPQCMREYEMFPTPELTAVSAVRRSGDCISPASSLLLVPPGPSCSPAVLQNTEIHCSGQARQPPAALGPTQSCPSQQNYKETFWWNYLFHGKREIQASLDLPADSFLSWFLLDCYKKNIARY